MNYEGSFQPWSPIADYDGGSLLTATVLHEFPKLRIRLHRGFNKDGASLGQDLVLTFSNVPASMVHEEFVHPHYRKKVIYPRNPDTNALYACLLVSGTQWLASFTETELLMYKDCKHYRFLTDVPIVDVLSTGDVSAEWQEQQEG